MSSRRGVGIFLLRAPKTSFALYCNILCFSSWQTLSADADFNKFTNVSSSNSKREVIKTKTNGCMLSLKRVSALQRGECLNEFCKSPLKIDRSITSGFAFFQKQRAASKSNPEMENGRQLQVEIESQNEFRQLGRNRDKQPK